jgi:ribosomal protein S18 acetylase RimI-like enzyme
MSIHLALRPIRNDDIGILKAVYQASRAWEQAFFGFDDAQWLAFIEQQFQLQHHHYRSHYPEANFDCVLQNENAIGRLYVDRGATSIQLMDINLLPQFQQQGIGTHLLLQLIDEAEQSQKTLRAYVEENNHARAWYAKHGFCEVSQQTPYILIERRFATPSTSIQGN